MNLKALMLHFQAEDFQKRLTAAPRRCSTKCMYDDMWLCLANWAAKQRFDPLGPTAAQLATFLFSLIRHVAFRLKQPMATDPA